VEVANSNRAAVAIDPVAVVIVLAAATVHFDLATTRGPVRVAAVNSLDPATGQDDLATTIVRSDREITRDRLVQDKEAAVSSGSRAIGRIIGRTASRIATNGTTGGTTIATTFGTTGTITGITTTGTIGPTIGGDATTGAIRT
jgi:hypothetical protein